jgi:hypothetical protein
MKNEWVNEKSNKAKVHMKVYTKSSTTATQVTPIKLPKSYILQREGTQPQM